MPGVPFPVESYSSSCVHLEHDDRVRKKAKTQNAYPPKASEHSKSYIQCQFLFGNQLGVWEAQVGTNRN